MANNKVIILGAGVVSRSIHQIYELLSLKINGENGAANILVMVDGEEKISISDNTLSGNESLIYVESDDKNTTKHDLYFLTEILPTYRIPLEQFSITELARIVADISIGSKPENEAYTPPKTASKNNCPVLLNELQEINPDKFSRYLINQNKFIEDCLHEVKEDGKRKEQIESIKEVILNFEHLYAKIKIPLDIELNVLVVENNPTDNVLHEGLKKLKDCFKNLSFYLVRQNFQDFKKDVLLRQCPISPYIDKNSGHPYEPGETNVPADLSLNDIDLILQDIFLETEGISGSDFAKLYFNVAPQAMVFFLTNMDIETLAASGYDNKVDRLVGKDRIKGIMKYYYDRFHELYRPLLWKVFVDSKKRNESASLTDRASVRKLLGNIRTWTMAPKILFHGFALPEMVDHEFRHILGLWKMANNILGPFLERMPKDIMPKDDRILLALAIWLHDIGHRGDEHHYEPMEIREQHGSISESLILEHNRSLGIEWLKQFCGTENAEVSCMGLSFRNKKSGCYNEHICALRKLGLMCRYHQSNAPLTTEKLKILIPKLKMPSPYCIVGMEDFKNEVQDDHNNQIEQWLNRRKDFGWFGTDVRTLEEFAGKDNLLMLTGMLRWLDALHTHSDKVGSLLEIKSFLSYLYMRKKHCKERIDEIDDLLDKTNEGSEAYLNLFAQRMRLDDYSQLLDVQGIHLWRSALVKKIYGVWHWDEINQEWAYRIIFELSKDDPLGADKEIIKDLEIAFIKTKLKGSDHIKQWCHHVWEEVIESENKGQTEDGKEPFFKQYFRGIKTYYICKDADGNQMEIGPCE